MSPEGLEETYIDFSNNKFPTDTGIMNLSHICRELDVFMETLDFNDSL